MSESQIPAEIHVSSDGEISKLGVHRFHALPRVGETIMLGENPADIWLRVQRVTHAAVAEAEANWEGIVILNCEIDS